jgi:phosphatidylinositol alpha-mannosyltransferase
MKVALVCPYDLGRPGGVQQQVLDLHRLLVEAGDEPLVVAPGAPAGIGVDAGPVVAIPANGSRVPITLSLLAPRRVRHALRGIEVAHIHEPLMPLVGPAALAAAVPAVATFHAAGSSLGGMAVRAAPRRWLAGRVLTAVSPAARERLPLDPDTIEIIPNGVEVASYHASSHTAGDRSHQRVAFLGRDEPRKGLPVLLQAWPAVRERFPGAELVVIGAGGTPGEGIVFAGRVSEQEKRELLASASVFVAPNRRGESFGITLVEAMASGCAVVASDLPAFRAVTGDAAVLVPPGDLRSLVAAIGGLLGDPERMAGLAAAGLQRAVDFDWRRVFPAYRRCYQRAAGAASTGR